MRRMNIAKEPAALLLSWNRHSSVPRGLVDWSVRYFEITHRQRPCVLSVCMMDLNTVHIIFSHHHTNYQSSD